MKKSSSIIGTRKIIEALLLQRLTSPNSSFCFRMLSSTPTSQYLWYKHRKERDGHIPLNSSLCQQKSSFFKPNSWTSTLALRFVNTTSSSSSSSSSEDIESSEEELVQSERSEEGETTDGWEEEDETEAEIGDGGDGGGVVLQGVPWGDRTLSIAKEALSSLGNDLELYSFKTSPRGYIYVRLDKLSDEYGCPSLEELEIFSAQYKKRLEEVGALGEIPDDLALEVSTPGAERLLRVPDDLVRFKELPMTVSYKEHLGSSLHEKDGVFLLERVESESCVWKLADVKENRDPQSKGRPLSRKQKDRRLELPFSMHTRVALYVEA